MNVFYNKLVDMYAGGELTEELATELETAAKEDAALDQEMRSLTKTVEILKAYACEPLTEESDYRILLRMQLQGHDIRRKSPDQSHWQYHLPINS